MVTRRHQRLQEKAEEAVAQEANSQSTVGELVTLLAGIHEDAKPTRERWAVEEAGGDLCNVSEDLSEMGR